MTTNGWPKCQINYNLRESGGNVLESSTLINFRSDSLQEAISLFEEAKEKLNNRSEHTNGKNNDIVLKFLDSNQKPCPVCGEPMVLRTAKNGKNPGRRFWGCNRYPVCDGTLPC